MIKGYVDDNLDAKVPLSILDKNGRASLLDAVVVDTGFNEDLCISIYELEKIHLVLFDSAEFELADGKVVKQKVYHGRVVFDGQNMPVKVIVSASRDTLIGSSLLANKKLDIDYPKRRVLIKPSKPRKKK
jgi:clan AA aspartic protease